jgi:hypothetical protein
LARDTQISINRSSLPDLRTFPKVFSYRVINLAIVIRTGYIRKAVRKTTWREGDSSYRDILIYLYLTGVHPTSVYLMDVYLMDVYLMDVCLIDVYLTDMYFTGVHLMGVHPMVVHLMGVYLMGGYTSWVCTS